jgi:type II secretory pathway component PulF
MINALVGKLEPAMTVIMGIMVGFALIAVYLPMFSYMTYLNLK